MIQLISLPSDDGCTSSIQRHFFFVYLLYLCFINEARGFSFSYSYDPQNHPVRWMMQERACDGTKNKVPFLNPSAGSNYTVVSFLQGPVRIFPVLSDGYSAFPFRMPFWLASDCLRACSSICAWCKSSSASFPHRKLSPASGSSSFAQHMWWWWQSVSASWGQTSWAKWQMWACGLLARELCTLMASAPEGMRNASSRWCLVLVLTGLEQWCNRTAGR